VVSTILVLIVGAKNPRCPFEVSEAQLASLQTTLCDRSYWYSGGHVYVSMADLGGYYRGHFPQTSDELFCSAKTDFRANWPIPQVVQMQKNFQLQGPLTRGYAPGPRWRLCRQTLTLVISSGCALTVCPQNLSLDPLVALIRMVEA